MIKILFICHGNICRSPMAEFVMKDLAERAGVAEQKNHRGPALGAGDVRFYRQPDHSPPDVPALGSGRGQGDPHPVPYSYEKFLYRGRKEKFAGCVFLPFAPLM